MKKNQNEQAKKDARLTLRQVREWEDNVLDGVDPYMRIQAATVLMVKAIMDESKDEDDVMFHITRAPFDLWMMFNILGVEFKAKRK